MPNGVKYSTTTPSGSLRRDNVALGVNGNLGPTANTGFYSMPAPQSGKYIINKVAASGVPLFFAPQNDDELIRFARQEGATGADTGSVAAILSWIAIQPNLEAANFEYENIVTDGLVLNLDAGFVGSYPTTASTWYDISGNANNGPLINGPTFNSANSGSIVFDGVDDYATTTPGLTPSLNITSSITLETWLMATALANALHGDGVNSKGLSSDNNSGVYETLLIPSGSVNTPYFRMRIGSSTPVYNPNTPIVLNQIYHFVSTYDGNTIRIYINGIESGNGLAQTGDIQVNTQQLTVGVRFLQRGGVADSFFSGRIYTNRIYNRSLSQAEITQNYNATKGRFGL